MVGQWSRSNFGDQPSYLPLLGVAEETGELCHAHLKGEQGIRHTPTEVRALKIDAIGDIIIYLADYCEREGISLAEAVEKTWEVVEKRIWDAAKKVQCQHVVHKGLPGEGRCPLKKGHAGVHRGPFVGTGNPPRRCGKVVPPNQKGCILPKEHPGECRWL